MKLLLHKNKVEEEAGAQAEAQEKKDEAEIQVYQLVHPQRPKEQEGCGRPGS